MYQVSKFSLIDKSEHFQFNLKRELNFRSLFTQKLETYNKIFHGLLYTSKVDYWAFQIMIFDIFFIIDLCYFRNFFYPEKIPTLEYHSRNWITLTFYSKCRNYGLFLIDSLSEKATLSISKLYILRLYFLTNTWKAWPFLSWNIWKIFFII